MASREVSDEAWVIDVCDAIVGETAIRQATFDWLRGDPSPTSGRPAKLRVDAYWPRAGLVVEYREKQHYEPVSHFDKPHRMTISGVHRGEQRARYDRLREELIPSNGLRLVIVRSDQLDCDGRGRLRHNAEYDDAALRRLLDVRR